MGPLSTLVVLNRVAPAAATRPPLPAGLVDVSGLHTVAGRLAARGAATQRRTHRLTM
jgi:hypothetical protein